MAYHNMCTKLLPPPGLDSLVLGLGHKNSVDSPKVEVKYAIVQYTRQVWLQYWLTHDPAALSTIAGEDDYIPGLYVPLSWNPPQSTVGNTELAMMTFANQIERVANATQQQ
jgi:hypothetical protein